MFAKIETAARRIWEVSPYCSSFEKDLVNLYIKRTNLRLSCQTLKSLNEEIFSSSLILNTIYHILNTTLRRDFPKVWTFAFRRIDDDPGSGSSISNVADRRVVITNDRRGRHQFLNILSQGRNSRVKRNYPIIASSEASRNIKFGAVAAVRTALGNGWIRSVNAKILQAGQIARFIHTNPINIRVSRASVGKRNLVRQCVAVVDYGWTNIWNAINRNNTVRRIGKSGAARQIHGWIFGWICAFHDWWIVDKWSNDIIIHISGGRWRIHIRGCIGRKRIWWVDSDITGRDCAAINSKASFIRRSIGPVYSQHSTNSIINTWLSATAAHSWSTWLQIEWVHNNKRNSKTRISFSHTVISIITNV